MIRTPRGHERAACMVRLRRFSPRATAHDRSGVLTHVRAYCYSLVGAAVSGHATVEMQRHYSMVSGIEMRESLAKVVSLAGFRDALAANDAASATTGPTDGTSGVKSGVK